MKPYALLLVILSLPVQAGSDKIAEKKAIRREMIELDIAVRNLASIIATADKKMIDDTLERLVTWQIKDHPEHGKVFREVLGRWETTGAIKFGRQIHTEANALRGYASARGKFGAADWLRLNQGMTKILTACQGCHEMTLKKD